MAAFGLFLLLSAAGESPRPHPGPLCTAEPPPRTPGTPSQTPGSLPRTPRSPSQTPEIPTETWGPFPDSWEPSPDTRICFPNSRVPPGTPGLLPGYLGHLHGHLEPHPPVRAPHPGCRGRCPHTWIPPKCLEIAVPNTCIPSWVSVFPSQAPGAPPKRLGPLPVMGLQAHRSGRVPACCSMGGGMEGVTLLTPCVPHQ